MTMPTPCRTLALLALAGLVLTSLLSPSAAEEKGKAPRPFSQEELAFFDRQVKPILQAHCLRCHGDKKARGGLRLHSRAGLLKGGDLGPAVSLERPHESTLLKAVNYKEGLEMPPTGKLVQRDIDVLTRWVQMGLPYPAGGTEVAKTPAAEGGKVTPEAKNYWAYRPVKRPEVPEVKNAGWVSNPVDAFLLHKMEEKGLSPTPPADRVALVRRVYYDLTGLPPTPEQVDEFVKDASPRAYEKLLDRLLASPHYGEKWGRHWLDLVRYAESHGYERDSFKPFAWRYRDYVIGSFNADKPYDTFVREQLAGDELDEVTAETMTATGYYRLGIWDDEPADRLLAKYDVLDGVVSTTAQVVLGMSVGCARCHDHKRDPIPQKDYYRLLAFFHDITDMNVRNTRRIATERDRLALERKLKEKQAREGELYQEVYNLEQQLGLALAKRGLGAAKAASDLTDLSYRFYRDTWESLPEFDSLKPETTGPIASNRISLAPASRPEAVGLVFTGKLKVPARGTYLFHVESADGVRLRVDGRTVLDKPARGTYRTEAKADLPAGLVSFRLDYFNTTGKPLLKLAWSGPGMLKRDLTEEGSDRILVPDSRQEGATWAYTYRDPGSGWMRADFDASSWRTGPGGFGMRGTPGAVVRTTWRTKDIWLRRTFEVKEVPQTLALDLHHDDDVEVYLNGEQVYKSAGYLVAYKRIALGPEAVKALRKGSNVLAVHCRQTTGGQYIDAGLVEGGALSTAEAMRRHGADLLGTEVPDRYARLARELEASRSTKIPEVGLEVMCVEERGSSPTFVLVRGNPTAHGPQVEPGFPQVLTDEPAKLPRLPAGVKSSGKRRALAEWLVRPDNPLTARVIVNRLWQYHFGRGIVPTSNDFGKLGEAPTHPELLDWLAADFVKGGWKMKRMHKLLMMSSAYRMSSQGSEKALAADPGNMLFWRFNMRRLTAEEVRDSFLAVSGQLNLKAGGPGVYPRIPAEVLAGQSRPGDGWFTSTPQEAARRSVYVHVKRSLQVPILAHHDQADTDSSCAVRYTTTVPTQALGMLNGQFTNEQASALAERLRREAPGDLAAQVRRAVRLTTGRQPRQEEVKRDVAFVREAQKRGALSEERALELYALLALNTNEFLYLD